MTNLFDELTRLITKQGLNVYAEGEATIIQRTATRAVIPTGSTPPDNATPEQLLVRALIGEERLSELGMMLRIGQAISLARPR